MANTLQSNSDFAAAIERAKLRMEAWFNETMPSGKTREDEQSDRLRACIDWTTKARIGDIFGYAQINGRRVCVRCKRRPQ